MRGPIAVPSRPELQRGLGEGTPSCVCIGEGGPLVRAGVMGCFIAPRHSVGLAFESARRAGIE